MSQKIDVGIGPMSLEVIDAIVDYANDFNKVIMLIASRNQIETSRLDGGYVGGLTTQSFVERVRARDGYGLIKICRDHSGPYLNAAEKNMDYTEAMHRTKISLEDDILAGFDLIHIDPSSAPDPYKAGQSLFIHCLNTMYQAGKRVQFEFGSEENVGVAASAEKFEKDIKFALDFVHPKYVVGQTGSLVKSVYQVGTFNEDNVKRLVEIANKYDVKLKEHNADYLEAEDIQKKIELGVGAINIAPEFGTLQTFIITSLADQYGLDNELNNFKNTVIDGKKWQKWAWGDNFDDDLMYACAGHYHFTSDAYYRLVDKIEQESNWPIFDHVKLGVYNALGVYVQ